MSELEDGDGNVGESLLEDLLARHNGLRQLVAASLDDRSLGRVARVSREAARSTRGRGLPVAPDRHEGVVYSYDELEMYFCGGAASRPPFAVTGLVLPSRGGASVVAPGEDVRTRLIRRHAGTLRRLLCGDDRPETPPVSMAQLLSLDGLEELDMTNGVAPVGGVFAWPERAVPAWRHLRVLNLQDAGSRAVPSESNTDGSDAPRTSTVPRRRWVRRLPEAFVCSLGALRLLNLRGCALEGPLPAALGALSALADLRLGQNQLTGPLPGPPLAALAPTLTSLRLQGNRLTGAIPPELAALTGLRVLRLDWNALRDPLPRGLFGATRVLEELSLASNALSGAFPTAAVERLTRLRDLRVSFNRFTGANPTRRLRGALGARCDELHTQGNEWGDGDDDADAWSDMDSASDDGSFEWAMESAPHNDVGDAEDAGAAAGVMI